MIGGPAMKPLMTPLACLFLCSGMIAPALAQTGTGTGTGTTTTTTTGTNSPYTVRPFIPTPLPDPPAAKAGIVTEEGVIIMPADGNGYLTPAQLETARRLQDARAKKGILENPPPAMGMDEDGKAHVVSGASIK